MTPQLTHQDEITEIFLDDVEIEAVDRLERVVHQPTLVSEEPVLAPEHPWEGVQTSPATVIYDASLGRFRMWYQTYYAAPEAEEVGGWEGPALRARGQVYGVGYAESEDGLVWEKPALGRVRHSGQDTNLAIRGWGAPAPQSVVHRPDHPNPNERYRLYVWDDLPTPGRHSVIGMSTYVSRDGYDWKGLEWAESTPDFDDPQPFCYVKHVGNYRYPTSVGPGETNTIFWDDHLGKFVNYCRVSNGSVRSIGRIESQDGVHWTRPTIVCQPDLRDSFRCQFYSAGAMRWGQSIVLLLHCCHMKDWTIDCQLATSRDGCHFTRVADRQTFIPLGPGGSATAGMLFPLAPIAHGGRWLIYAGACPVGHHAERLVVSAVVYEMRPEGFVSFRAGGEEGSLVTRSFCWLHDSISVNANAERGSVRLEVYDANLIGGSTLASFDDAYPAPIDGFGKDDCIPLTSDSHGHTFRFQSADLGQLRGQHLKFRFFVRDADLYSWTRRRSSGC